MPPRVGVLALQGAFREHVRALRALGADAFPMRTRAEIESVDAAVLPGGESTTMDKLLRKFDLQEPLRRRVVEGMPVLATCAGLILLADEVRDGLPDQESLHVVPIAVRRNAYGRQPDSFEAPLDFRGLSSAFPGVFIRAPSIEQVNDPSIEVLAAVEGRPVAVRYGGIVGLVFHPELTDDLRVHGLFLDGVTAADALGRRTGTA